MWDKKGSRSREAEEAKEPRGPGEPGAGGSEEAEGTDGTENRADEATLTGPGLLPSESGAEATPDPAIGSKEREYLEDLQRITAEFANYRRRVQREKTDWDARAKADLLTLLLPVLDDLGRARAHWNEKPLEKDADGLLMILARLEEILRSVGLEVQEIEPGTPFDPHQHDALATCVSEEHQEGTIADTLQPGYLYRGMLLRPARVRVSQGPPVETP